MANDSTHHKKRIGKRKKIEEAVICTIVNKCVMLVLSSIVNIYFGMMWFFDVNGKTCSIQLFFYFFFIQPFIRLVNECNGRGANLFVLYL